jgi:hypothetical protein
MLVAGMGSLNGLSPAQQVVYRYEGPPTTGHKSAAPLTRLQQLAITCTD